MNKTKESLVSVAISNLNRIQYFEPALRSILQQDSESIEGIVVNGASTNGKVEYLKKCNPPIHWISESDEDNADVFWIKPSWILIGVKR